MGGERGREVGDDEKRGGAVSDPRGTAEVRQPVDRRRAAVGSGGDQLGSDEWEREKIGDIFVSGGASAALRRDTGILGHHGLLRTNAEERGIER